MEGRDIERTRIVSNVVKLYILRKVRGWGASGGRYVIPTSNVWSPGFITSGMGQEILVRGDCDRESYVKLLLVSARICLLQSLAHLPPLS